MSVATAATPIDPITLEVIRNKLRSITEEQAITLKSVSGSPVVTEATDFNNGLYLADGSIATMGPQVLFHAGAMASVIRSVIRDFAESPGIREGDMFILNDPYRGAVHQSDVAIVAPIFYDGRHVAWAGSCAHQLDFGGMAFGGWAYAATEVQQESLLLPGVMIVEGGVLRADIWEMIMCATRLPHVIGLDLKAMIAANRVASRRLGELMDRYGDDVVERVMESEIETSERRLRERLRSLPNGTFRAVDFLEHDGHENRLYDFRLTLRKQDDELIFDMSGSSPQAPGFINCARGGLMGALLTALIPILAPDILWNEGILRPVTVYSPEGLVCNPTWPAPVSSATVSGVWACMDVGVATLARLASCSPKLRAEAPAVTKGSMMCFTIHGRDRDGAPYGNFLLDSMAGGGGAYVDHDGLDASGDFDVPRPTIANVEAIEGAGPILYLYRSFVPDTAGPGRRRGGASLGVAVTPHDTEELRAMLIGHGCEVPNSAGLFGGLEGSCNECAVAEGDGAEPPVGRITDHESLQTAGFRVTDLGPKPGFFPLRAGSVFSYSFMGGGGFGDPIDREPELVLADAEAGFVSVESAERHYGVVVRHGAVDRAATEARRRAIRRERLGGAEPARPPGPPHVLALVAADGRFGCRCGQDLGPWNVNWKHVAATRMVAADDHGVRIRLREELELREHCCPGCGTLLESELVRKGDPDLQTIELDG